MASPVLKFPAIIAELKEMNFKTVGFHTLEGVIINQTGCLTPQSIKQVVRGMILTGYLKEDGMRFEICIERKKFASDDIKIDKADEEADKLLDGLVGAK